MKNRLISDAHRKMVGPLYIENRCTGRSTARALQAIATALHNPNEDVEVIDHHPSTQADDCLMNTCYDIVNKLGLRFFTFNRSRRTLRCDLYE